MANVGRTEKMLVKYLSKRGEQIALKALNSVTYTARTGNLDDSFVWGVFKQGKVVDGAYGCAQPQSAAEPRKWYGKELWGHEVAMDFIHNFKPKTNGYALVVAAVMPYGEVVENRYKYRVISTAQNDLQTLTASFKGSKTSIIHRGKAQ